MKTSVIDVGGILSVLSGSEWKSGLARCRVSKA